MIKTIKDKQLKAIWETGKSRIDSRLHERILLRLAYLDEAESLEHLNLPGFDFHELQGYSPKRYTVHVKETLKNLPKLKNMSANGDEILMYS